MPVLIALILAVAIEVSVLILVGNAIGVFATLGLLVLASVLGTVLLRREGSRTLAAFIDAVRTRRPPESELVDGVLVAAGGMLILLPGFVSDVLALPCLVPPSRRVLRRRLMRSHARSGRVRVGFARGGTVDGEVVDRRRRNAGTGMRVLPDDVRNRRDGSSDTQA